MVNVTTISAVPPIKSAAPVKYDHMTQTGDFRSELTKQTFDGNGRPTDSRWD